MSLELYRPLAPTAKHRMKFWGLTPWPHFLCWLSASCHRRWAESPLCSCIIQATLCFLTTTSRYQSTDQLPHMSSHLVIKHLNTAQDVLRQPVYCGSDKTLNTLICVWKQIYLSILCPCDDCEKITQTIWHSLLANHFLDQAKSLLTGWHGNLKNKEAWQYEGARRPVKLIASAFLFEQTWGIVCTGNPHLHPYQQYPMSQPQTACQLDF